MRDRRRRDLALELRRDGDRDEVDLGIGDEGAPRVVRPGDPEGRGDARGLVRIGRAERSHPRARIASERRNVDRLAEADTDLTDRYLDGVPPSARR